MSLVLAFGVIGIADALTLRKSSNSGDLQTVFSEQGVYHFLLRVARQ